MIERELLRSSYNFVYFVKASGGCIIACFGLGVRAHMHSVNNRNYVFTRVTLGVPFDSEKLSFQSFEMSFLFQFSHASGHGLFVIIDEASWEGEAGFIRIVLSSYEKHLR